MVFFPGVLLPISLHENTFLTSTIFCRWQLDDVQCLLAPCHHLRDEIQNPRLHSQGLIRFCPHFFVRCHCSDTLAQWGGEGFQNPSDAFRTLDSFLVLCLRIYWLLPPKESFLHCYLTPHHSDRSSKATCWELPCSMGPFRRYQGHSCLFCILGSMLVLSTHQCLP